MDASKRARSAKCSEITATSAAKREMASHITGAPGVMFFFKQGFQDGEGHNLCGRRMEPEGIGARSLPGAKRAAKLKGPPFFGGPRLFLFTLVTLFKGGSGAYEDRKVAAFKFSES